MNDKTNGFHDKAMAVIEKHSISLKEELGKIFKEIFAYKDKAAEVFEAVWENWGIEEAPEIGSKIISVFNKTCDKEELKLWDYDLLEFIIELSTKYRLKLPKAIINGLPEQIILLIDSDLLE